MNWALQLLGLMAERVTEEKSTKQIFTHTAGPTNKDKPQANAVVDPRGKGRGNPKNTKDTTPNPQTNLRLASFLMLTADAGREASVRGIILA
eukprot:1284679-Amphidinium_carterae.1